MTRAPVVAGFFYEANSEKLKEQIKNCFLDDKGPGSLKIEKRKDVVKAVIAPHAGYAYSGPCAAWAYKEIGEAEFPDAYIILGTDHSGGGSSIGFDNFETPLGIVRIDQDLAKLISEKTGLVLDKSAHKGEHSIEVHLPFLQFVSMDFENELKIVPILVSHDIELKDVSIGLKEAIMDSGKRVCIIASSDFTHYGHNYHYVPFTSDIPKNLHEVDNKAIEFIKKMDSKGFLDYVEESGATICGVLPIILLMQTIKASKVSLLQYYTSGDIAGNYKNSVGYASIAFY
jgi:hypothetical protein